MIRAYFYCSYNLSALGYRLALADYEQQSMHLVEKTAPQGLPDSVRTFFYQGGARIVLGAVKVPTLSYYFVVKGIRVEDEAKSVDEQGRKVFTNLAFVADGEDKDNLVSLSKYILGDFSTSARDITKMICVENDDIGFSLDYRELKAYIERAKNKGTEVVGKVPNKTMEKVLTSASLLDGTPFSFVVYETTWEYFSQAYKVSDTRTKPKLFMSSDEFTTYAKEKTRYVHYRSKTSEGPKAPQEQDLGGRPSLRGRRGVCVPATVVVDGRSDKSSSDEEDLSSRKGRTRRESQGVPSHKAHEVKIPSKDKGNLVLILCLVLLALGIVAAVVFFWFLKQRG